MAEVRPTRLGDTDIHEAVVKIRETPDLWRVYCKEWWIVFACNTDGEAIDHYADNYQGRLEPEDWRSIEWAFGGRALELRLWNLKGEYKHRELADQLAATLTDAVVVPRSSRDEQDLLGYGKRKLARQ